jgi:hypothetical protein
MNKLLSLLTCIGFLFFSDAKAQIKFPAPSPTQTIKQDFG